MESQYSMKNNQYYNELILSVDLIKNHHQNYPGTTKMDNKTLKHTYFRKQNKSGYKE